MHILGLKEPVSVWSVQALLVRIPFDAAPFRVVRRDQLYGILGGSGLYCVPGTRSRPVTGIEYFNVIFTWVISQVLILWDSSSRVSFGILDWLGHESIHEISVWLLLHMRFTLTRLIKVTGMCSTRVSESEFVPRCVLLLDARRVFGHHDHVMPMSVGSRGSTRSTRTAQIWRVGRTVMVLRRVRRRFLYDHHRCGVFWSRRSLNVDDDVFVLTAIVGGDSSSSVSG